MTNKWVKFAALVGFFTVLTVIFTYPAALNLTTHFIGDGGDALQNVWNFWWFKRSIFELGTSPFYTDLLHYPYGISLLLQTYSLANVLIALPLSVFLGLQATYNIVVMFSFVASGVTMFYLARHLTKHDLGSLAAGCIYAFSAYHFAHAMGHINLMSIQWLPLFVLFLLKTLKDGGLKNGLLLGLSLILVGLSSWIYLLYACILGLILVVWHFKDLLRAKKKFLFIGAGALLFLIVVGPIIFGMVKVILFEGVYGHHEPELWNADISAYFVPGRFSTFGGFFEGIWSNWNANAVEASLFLGFAAIILSVYALIKYIDSRKWGIIAFVFFILSLGPTLRFFGMNFDIFMPYDILGHLPLMNFSAVTVRFGVIVSFCFAILSAFAISGFKKKKLWPILIIIFILIESLHIPYTITKVDIPEFYYEIAEDQRDYSIIEVPNNSRPLYNQMVHKKPLIGGYVSRMTLLRYAFLKQTPVVNSFFTAYPYEEVPNAQKFFQIYKIKYIILNNDEHLEYVRDNLGLEIVYDKEMKVFDTGI